MSRDDSGAPAPPTPWYLPKTRVPALRAAIMVYATAALATASWFAFRVLSRTPTDPTGLALHLVLVSLTAAPLALSAVGLWRMRAWGRVLTCLVLWLSVVATALLWVPPGPRLVTATDEALWMAIALVYAGITVPALLLLHIFGKFRDEFEG